MIEVEWFKAPNVSYTADIEVHANDRRGLIVDYTTAITQWMQAQYAYQASMQVASASMGMSLLNYMQ